MPARLARIVLAGGLAANAGVIRHPLPLALAQAVLAVVVLTGWGGTVALALGALVLVPAPIAELRRSLSHVPLACDCQRTSGHSGLWPIAGALADTALIGLAVSLARRTEPTSTGADTTTLP
jgi:hypothetical protein